MLEDVSAGLIVIDPAWWWIQYIGTAWCCRRGIRQRACHKTFHLIVPEAHHLKHLLGGGALMGIGAICAGGCNIGNGLTGMSTGSVRALTAVLAIVAGMLMGLALLTRTEKVGRRDYHAHQTTHSVGT